MSTAGDEAERQIYECLTSCGDGVPAPSGPELSRMSWLEFALNPFPDLFGMPPDGVSVKAKDTMLKEAVHRTSGRVAYDHLTSTDHDVMGGMLGLMSYGGRVNTVSPNAIASPQRSSIFDTACTTGWLDPHDEEKEPGLGPHVLP